MKTGLKGIFAVFISVSVFLAGCSHQDVSEDLTPVSEESMAFADKLSGSIEDAGLPESGTQSSDTEQEMGDAAEQVVFVCGAVKDPGVYSLPQGSRIGEAVDAAGGFLDTAHRMWLNLAEPVTDGMRIYVPTEAEVAEWEEDSAAAGINPMPGEMPQDGSVTAAGVPDDSGTVYAETGKVNINTASRDELMTLNGIGESKADSIIRYREENGPFQDIRDIMNISGIKEGVFNKIKEDITI